MKPYSTRKWIALKALSVVTCLLGIGIFFLDPKSLFVTDFFIEIAGLLGLGFSIDTLRKVTYRSALSSRWDPKNSLLKLSRSEVKKIGLQLMRTYGKNSIKDQLYSWVASDFLTLKLRSWVYFYYLEEINREFFDSDLDFKMLIKETRDKCVALVSSGQDNISVRTLYNAIYNLVAPLQEIQRKLLELSIAQKRPGYERLRWTVRPSVSFIASLVNNLIETFDIPEDITIAGSDLFVTQLAIDSSFSLTQAQEVQKQLNEYVRWSNIEKDWWDNPQPTNLTADSEYLKQLRKLAEIAFYLENMPALASQCFPHNSLEAVNNTLNVLLDNIS